MLVSAISRPELFALLGAARAVRERDWLLILVTYWHALRASEATQITRDSIQDGLLTVQRLKGSLRTVQPLIAHENALLNEREPLLAFSQKLLEKQILFPIKRLQFWKLMRAYGKAAGIPAHKCHPHILKHSICSHLVGNVPLEVIREWAGHRNLSSTGFYTRLSADAVGEAVQKSALLA